MRVVRMTNDKGDKNPRPQFLDAVATSVGAVIDEERRISPILLMIGAVLGGTVLGGFGFYYFGLSWAIVGGVVGAVLGSIGLWLLYMSTTLFF